MMPDECEKKVEALFLKGEDRVLTPEVKGWISIYCRAGLDAKWIAFRLERLLTRKEFLKQMKLKYPSLLNSDFEKSLTDYLNGVAVTAIDVELAGLDQIKKTKAANAAAVANSSSPGDKL